MLELTWQQVIEKNNNILQTYTLADIIKDESAEVIANSLVRMCCVLRPASINGLIIRVDPTPACRSLFMNLDSIQG